jgi:hypothetical protein
MDRYLYIEASMYCQEHLRPVFKCAIVAAANFTKLAEFILSKVASPVGSGNINVERHLGGGIDPQEGSWKPEHPASPDWPRHAFP